MNAYQLGRKLAKATMLQKRAGIGRAFLSGIDPLGTGTMQLGQDTPESQYMPMQLAGVAGGLVGGGLLVPSALTGAAAVAPEFRAILSQPASGGGLARRFWQGAIRPYQSLWHGARGYRTLAQHARTGAALPAAASKQLAATIMRGTSLEQARNLVQQFAPQLTRAIPASARGSTDALVSHVQQLLSNPATSAKTIRSAASTLKPQLGRSIAAGGMLIGIPALLAGYAAYKQYKLGQQVRSKLRAQQAAGGSQWL
jgi:hypothetical protein